jgi:hypothetical protein
MEKKNTNKILVEREIFEKDGKTYFNYFIKGTVRGKEVKVLITPPDFGGYAVLDIVFNGENKAELISTPFEIKDSATKSVIKGNKYSVVSNDADGTSYECQIKPLRVSDKALLAMLLKQ